jgi:hypothetical protein
MGEERQRLVDAALASARIPPALERVSRGVLNGLWLGLLSDKGLRALDERHHDAEGAYRTAEWNEPGLFEWERALVERHVAAGGRVVVVGAGGGREVLGLLEGGYDAVGYEPHPGLAEFGRELLARHGHADRVHVSRPSELPGDGSGLDGVIVGWGTYSLIRPGAARVALLTSARERLTAGGALLLSHFEAPRHGRELRATRAIANALRRARGRAEVELGDTLAPHLAHVFTREQVGEEVAAAGLEVVEHRLIAHAHGPVNYAALVVRAP